jgi:hypothetical protein
MATNQLNTKLGIVEVANRTHNNRVMAISEVLSKIIPLAADGVFIECNNQDSYVFDQRLSLPSGTWRKLNSGVSEEASLTKQVEEGVGMLEAYSTVDMKVLELAGDRAAFLATELEAFLEGLMQTFGTAILYANTTTTPERIDGWATRYASTGTLVRSASGSGSDTTSAWMIQHGPMKCHFIYPQGSEVGLSARDLGEQTILDGSSNPYQANRTHFKFHVGFAVHDNRAISRVANIETAGQANLFDPDLMIANRNQMLQRAAGAVIYGNATLLTQMDIQAMDKGNVYYTSREVFGMPQTHFQQIPVHQFDMITDTETAIS